MRKELFNSLQEIIESEEHILIYFKDKSINYSTLVDSYNIEININYLKFESGWTDVTIDLSNVVDYDYIESLNGYGIFGQDWEMYLHTGGTM